MQNIFELLYYASFLNSQLGIKYIVQGIESPLKNKIFLNRKNITKTLVFTWPI